MFRILARAKQNANFWIPRAVLNNEFLVNFDLSEFSWKQIEKLPTNAKQFLKGFPLLLLIHYISYVPIPNAFSYFFS